jgi:glycine cleavage system H protein
MTEYLETTYKKFIFKVKVGYLYSKEDFWIDISDKVATIGLSDYLQKSKGDVAFLETVVPGTQVKVGQELGKIETIKATFGIISPVPGQIIQVNPVLDVSPQLLNTDPYGDGWIYKIELTDAQAARSLLLDAESYLKLMTEKVEKEAKRLYG